MLTTSTCSIRASQNTGVEPEEAEGGGAVVEQRVLADGGVDADDDREQDRDQLRGDHELQGVAHHAAEVVQIGRSPMIVEPNLSVTASSSQ